MNPSFSTNAMSAATLASAFAQRPGPPMPASLYHPVEAGTLATLLGRLPAPVREAGSQVAARYRKLSTTQKVVGGALLLLVGQRLLRGKKPTGKPADTLHELLYFVNDRVAGYQKAVQESQHDPERRRYYQRLVNQSQQFARALNDNLRRLGGERLTSTTLKGKLYRRFMAAAATATGHDDQTVLATNLHGEQWALQAYEQALADETLHGALRQEVAHQYRQSQQTYQQLQRLAA